MAFWTMHFFILGNLVLLAGEGSPDAGAESGTHERGADEYPEILEGLAACKDGGTDGTCGVDGSAGEVDAHEVYQNQRQTDGQTCEVACADLAVGGAKHYEYEDEGCDDLNEECTPGAAGIGYAVGAETAGEVGCGDNVHECEQQGAGHDAADDLAAPVAEGIFPAHAAGQGDCQGDGGIDVASADAADGVGHGDDCKTEGDGCPYYSCGSVAAEEHCGAATEKSQHEGADAFSKVLFHDSKN